MPIKVLHRINICDEAAHAYFCIGKYHTTLMPSDLCEVVGVSVEAAVELVEFGLLSPKNVGEPIHIQLKEEIENGDYIEQDFEDIVEAVKFVKMNFMLMGLI